MIEKGDILTNILITDTASEGRSVGRYNDMVVFVEGAIPGDIIDVKVYRKKKKYIEGKCVNIVEPSPFRVAPPCIHFGTCGGCKWQNLDYAKQLEFKQKQVVDSFERLGDVRIPKLNTIIPSDNIYEYRNKLEFTFSNKRWLTLEELHATDEGKQMNALGFHLPRLFDKILPIQNCLLQPEPSNNIRNWVYNYAIKNNLTFYDLRNHTGLLRNLIIRNTLQKQVMVIFCFGHESDEMHQLLADFSTAFPEITSVQYVINSKKNDTISDLDIKLFRGTNFIYENLNELKFKISPKSFFQTNSSQTKKLYDVVVDYADLKGQETVYDLYTGTGTIANYIAQKTKKVIGIEFINEAIEDAKENSKINNIINTLFFAGDIVEVLTDDFIITQGHPDVLITDPPRAGMHPKVVSQIIKIEAHKIVYVSCNAATQARDIKLLEEKYELIEIQPLDMFPHTYHVENVALLKIKSITNYGK